MYLFFLDHSVEYDLNDIANLLSVLLQAICGIIRSTTEPIFAEYIGKFQIKSIDFETLSLGTLSPIVHGKYSSISWMAFY